MRSDLVIASEKNCHTAINLINSATTLIVYSGKIQWHENCQFHKQI